MATTEYTTQAQRLAESTSIPLGSPYGIEFPLDATDDHSGVPDSYEGVIALDPDVLASLVIQLRTNLLSTQTELSLTKAEREELITALAIAQTKISDLKFEKEDIRKAMADIKALNENESERARTLDKERADALAKVQESEEAIAMLRSKVEESRRALMRLQSEQNRRMSQLAAPSPMPMIASPFATSTTFDGLPRTPVPGTAGFPKRLSTPGGFSAYAGQSLLLSAPPKGRNAPTKQSSPDVNNDENSLSQQQERAARRQSLFVRPTESLLNPLGAELEGLRQELVAARMELDDTQARLKEEREAREASDVCIKALKECKYKSLVFPFLGAHYSGLVVCRFRRDRTLTEFPLRITVIAENAIGDPSSSVDGNSSIQGLTLPPLPTDDIPDTPPPPELPAKKGWGLASLWASAGETTPKAKAPPVNQQSTAAAAFGRWRSASNTSTSTSRTDNTNSTGPTQVVEDNYTPTPTRGGANRRVGLFGSVSSIGSASAIAHSPPRSIGSTTYPPSLVESRGSTSGASSEGPDSPDPKLAAALEQERVEIVQVQETAIDALGIVRPDAGVRFEKMSGEMTPTGGRARAHPDSVTMIA